MFTNDQYGGSAQVISRALFLESRR